MISNPKNRGNMKKNEEIEKPYEDYFEANDEAVFKALNSLLKKSWRDTHRVVGLGMIKSEKMFNSDTEDRWIIKVKKK
jgi:hypothetical protein